LAAENGLIFRAYHPISAPNPSSFEREQMADDRELDRNQDRILGADPANENEMPAAELPALEAQLTELRDKYLRAVAEAENVRKRAERDVTEVRAYGVSAFARDMLAVADNLARALDAIDPQARASAEGTLKALLEGVELTQRDLQKALAKHGVRRLEPEGEKFDPNFHQAMFELPAPEVTAGTVVQVMQPGYAIADRVLRPALVAVAKGGPKPAPAENRSEAADQPTGK
jgi:molecular chaperone GrpE